MQEFEYYVPKSFPALADFLAENEEARILAGGTDIIPRMRHGNLSVGALVDLSQLDGMQYIKEENGQIKIGAMTTHQTLENSELVKESALSLVEAVASIGCPQTRARGTLGGNIINASPAADMIPPLLTLEAEVVLGSSQGERVVALDEFVIGPGKTALRAGEFLRRVSFKRLSGRWGMAFLKLGKRKGMAISVANAAVALQLDDSDKVSDVRIALGSVAPTPKRCIRSEEMFIGAEPVTEVLQRTANAVAGEIEPISDVRASAEYRQRSAVILTLRALKVALERAKVN